MIHHKNEQKYFPLRKIYSISSAIQTPLGCILVRDDSEEALLSSPASLGSNFSLPIPASLIEIPEGDFDKYFPLLSWLISLKRLGCCTNSDGQDESECEEINLLDQDLVRYITFYVILYPLSLINGIGIISYQ